MSLRVAVTGGSGKIGRAVVKELVSRGHQVINLDRRNSPDGLCRFVFVDMRAREQVQPILEEVDAVIHTAEITNQAAPYSADEIFSHNTRVASVVLQTAADLKLKRAIYTSSCQAYGCWDQPRIAPERLPFDETLPLRPQNVYALSKFANEHYANFVAQRYGLSVAIFRFPWVILPENMHFMGHRRDDKPRPLDGFGTYLHVDDAARAYALAIENPRPGCEAYHFVAERIACSAPLADCLALMEGYPPLPADWPSHKAPALTDKARQHFGWAPKFDMLEAHSAAERKA